jgi:hypothetical protein
MAVIDLTLHRAVGGPQVTIYIHDHGNSDSNIPDAYALARILAMSLPSNVFGEFVERVNDIKGDLDSQGN